MIGPCNPSLPPCAEIPARALPLPKASVLLSFVYLFGCKWRAPSASNVLSGAPNPEMAGPVFRSAQGLHPVTDQPGRSLWSPAPPSSVFVFTMPRQGADAKLQAAGAPMSRCIDRGHSRAVTSARLCVLLSFVPSLARLRPFCRPETKTWIRGRPMANCLLDPRLPRCQPHIRDARLPRSIVQSNLAPCAPFFFQDLLSLCGMRTSGCIDIDSYSCKIDYALDVRVRAW
jgi:hypothetical protein